MSRLKYRTCAQIVLGVVLTGLLAACVPGNSANQASKKSNGGDASGTQTAAANGPDIKPMTLKFAMTTPETFPYMDGAKKFKELVEQKSGGKIKVELYPGGQLGAEKEINEQVLEGSLHVAIGAGAMAQLAPIYNLVELPFLIQGPKHMEAIATGPVGQKLAKRIEEQSGYRVVGWYSTGDSAIETAKAPVRTPADLKGVKIRVIENPVLVDSLKALGANPTPMPYPEIYTGLKQGVIEGAHLDLQSVLTIKVFEVAKYATDIDQITFLSEPRPLIMKAKFLDSLPSDVQKIITDAAAESAKVERDVFNQKMAVAMKDLAAQGVSFSQVDVKAFKQIMEPVWDKWAKQLGAEEILQEMKAFKK